MKLKIKFIAATIIMCATLILPTLSYAEIYTSVKIGHIVTDNDGRVGIKWKNSPQPGPCATLTEPNNGLVMIPATAAEAQKAMAIAMYLKEREVTIVTDGCDDEYESVKYLKSNHDEHDDD